MNFAVAQRLTILKYHLSKIIYHDSHWWSEHPFSLKGGAECCGMRGFMVMLQSQKSTAAFQSQNVG